MIEITVIGEPAPQGSKRHVGKGVMIESSKKVTPWRQDVVAAAKAVGKMTQGPVTVQMIFTLRKPASAPKTRRTFADKKPDLDKLIRSTADALVTAGVIEDDARIVELRAVKGFPGESAGTLPSGTGAQIRIWTTGEEGSQ
jgi:crossover junction endodeoxyribonuclease RusA